MRVPVVGRTRISHVRRIHVLREFKGVTVRVVRVSMEGLLGDRIVATTDDRVGGIRRAEGVDGVSHEAATQVLAQEAVGDGTVEGQGPRDVHPREHDSSSAVQEQAQVRLGPGVNQRPVGDPDISGMRRCPYHRSVCHLHLAGRRRRLWVILRLHRVELPFHCG